MYFLDPPSWFRVERGAHHLVLLGARGLAEFLAEGVREGDDLTILLARLQRYERCDPALLRALGGNQFPPRLQLVPR
jgi:hypothetical protein